MATLSHSALMTLWVLEGGSQALADTAAAVAQAESGGCQYAKHGPFDDRPVKQCSFNYSNGEDSYGLWQINRRAHPQFSPASLYTTEGNAKAAVSLATGSQPFYPWTTWRNGAYKRFLQSPSGPFPGPEVPADTSLAFIAAGSFKGWHHLSMTLGGAVPHYLGQSQKARQAALRTLR